MMLPEDFQFSQSSLQDYADCPRRFQLRHLLVQPWPAPVSGEPVELEEHLERGSRFHRLVHQHTLGLDGSELALSIHDPVLAGWWQTYLTNPPREVSDSFVRSEVVLSAPLAGHRLVAKFDLLAARPGQQMVVVDWKTVLERPSRQVLLARLQTQVYRYLAVAAGAAYFGGSAPAPDRVEMAYWFAAFDGATERFRYDSEQHQAYTNRLEELIAEIASPRARTWPLTPDARHCGRCRYRSLCERQVTPVLVGHLDADLDGGLPGLDLDLEQVAEIEF